MNKATTHLVSCLLVTFALVTIILAQQPQLLPNNPVAPAVDPKNLTTCIVLTTKPSPATTKYQFQTCIVAQFAGYLSIGQGKYIEIVNGTVNQTSSSCEKTTQNVSEPKLVVDFRCGSLSFEIDHNGAQTFVKAVNGMFQNTSGIVTFANTTEMFKTTQSGHYYKCNAEQSIPVKQDINLVLSNVAIEAYRNTNSTDFYQIAEECALDSQPVSDLVRIGVGVCLIALVAIVLIAYFIGRRRWSERSSYESV